MLETVAVRLVILLNANISFFRDTCYLQNVILPLILTGTGFAMLIKKIIVLSHSNNHPVVDP